MKKKDKPMPPPVMRSGLELGLYREVSRHELYPGSWQQEVHDKQGRRFYESTAKPEPIGRELSVHEAAAETAERGSSVMVFIQGINRSVPYEQYVEFLEADGRGNRQHAWEAANRLNDHEDQQTLQNIGTIATEQARVA